MGADHAVNGATQDVDRHVLDITGGRGVDGVFENLGGAAWPMALKSAGRGGRIVTCGATSGDQPGADLRRVLIRQLQIFGSTLGNLSELRDLMAFASHHRLTPVIDSTRPLADLYAALDRPATGQQFGKVAVNIAQPPG